MVDAKLYFAYRVSIYKLNKEDRSCNLLHLCLKVVSCRSAFRIDVVYCETKISFGPFLLYPDQRYIFRQSEHSAAPGIVEQQVFCTLCKISASHFLQLLIPV